MRLCSQLPAILHLVFGLMAGFAGAADEKPPRNVLFIGLDDLRTELGCYDNTVVKSPNIDRLATRGVVFRRAYCQQAICGPSRASLMSGNRPDTTGIHDLRTPLHVAMPDVVTLPQHFKRNGYRTGVVGKIYHHYLRDDPEGWTDAPPQRGAWWASRENADLQKLLRRKHALEGNPGSRTLANATESADVPDERYRDGQTTIQAIELLNSYHDQDTPFFLAVGYHRPHLPFTAPKRYWDLYDRDRLPLPDQTEPAGAPTFAFPDWGELRTYHDIPLKINGVRDLKLDDHTTRRLTHGYLASVSYVDALIGNLLAELDRLGLRENTIIMLWGDHGFKLGEYGDWCKFTNFEIDAQVPLIVVDPSRPGGGQSDALVELIDMYPTLAELAGLPLPAHLEGRSFAPLLENPERPWKDAAFSQYPRGEVMGYSMRTRDWRYTEWVTRDDKREVKAAELYDQRQGAFVHRNLVNDPEQADRVRQLSARLRRDWANPEPVRLPVDMPLQEALRRPSEAEGDPTAPARARGQYPRRTHGHAWPLVEEAVQAELYDMGERAVAWDSPSGEKPSYCLHGEDWGIRLATDEWVAYTVGAPAGTYTLSIRAASPAGGSASLSLKGKALIEVEIPPTKDAPEIIEVGEVTLPALDWDPLEVRAGKGAFDIDWIRFTPSSTISAP